MTYANRNISYSKDYENEFDWVEPSQKGKHWACCKWCGSDVQIQSMGRSALSSHAKGKKHQEKETLIRQTVPLTSIVRQNVNCNLPSTSIASATNAKHDETLKDNKKENLPDNFTNIVEKDKIVSQVKPKTIHNYVNKDDDVRAVIIWCLNAVMKHFSYRDTSDSVNIFPKMFPDSQIAARMRLSKDKVGYTIVFGLALYFRNQLSEFIEECEDIVVGFDESLNKCTKTQQMDVIVKFWNKFSNESDTRYLSSVFLTRSKAIDLKDGLIKAVGQERLNKIRQVSMDGPNVNFSMLKSLKLELTEIHPQNAVLIDIGSCGLHNINGAYKAGISAMKWGIVEFLKYVNYLFEDHPARKGHYTSITLSKLFPLPFCGTRWVENETVAQRAIDIFPHLEKWVKKVIEEGKKNDLNNGNKLFLAVSRFVLDKLALTKLSFFITAANLVQPFLVAFQSETPLAPLLYGELTYLTTNIMQRVVKPEVLENNSSVIKVEMKNENLLMAKDVDLGFRTRSALKAAKPSTDIALQFMNDCKNCYIAMIKKIQERSPLLYKMTKYITCLDPKLISSQTIIAQKRLDNCLETLHENNKLISGSTADKIKQEFSEVLRSTGVMDCMKKYDHHSKSLDKFWVEILEMSNQKCQNLKRFLQLILIMSHGNAALERGFSVNKEAMVENQTENSLIALRLI